MISFYHLWLLGAIIALLQIPSDRFLVKRGVLVYKNRKKDSAMYIWDTPLRVTFLRNLLVFVLGILYILLGSREVFRLDDIFIVSGFLILASVEYISEKKIPDKLWRRPNSWNAGGLAFYALYTYIFSAMLLAFAFSEMDAKGTVPGIALIVGVVAGAAIAIMPIGTYLMTRALGNDRTKNI